MYKFKIKILYNKEEFFCTKTEFSDFKITQLLAKLDMVSSKLVSNDSFFSDDILVDIQLVTFLLLSNISELSTGAKTKKIMMTIVTCKIHST